MLHLTNNNFKDEVLNSKLPVVVDFFADWCGPCKMIAPIMDEIAKEYDGKLKVAKLNVDSAPDISGEYGIMSIPTLLFFKDGKKAGHLVGVQPKPAIIEQIKKHLL